MGSWTIRLALTPATITSDLTSELMGQPTPQTMEWSNHNLIGQPTPQTVGGILDQDVIHYDTWLRKHSQYAFTRLSARCLKYSALENSRSLSPQAFTRTSTKKKEIKNPKDPILFARDHGDLKKYLVFKSIKLTATYIKVERGFLLHHQFKHARNWFIRGNKHRVCVCLCVGGISWWEER